MMPNKLSVDGVIVEFPKQLNPSSPYSLIEQANGIEIDWGNGDIEIIEGSTWEIESSGIYTLSMNNRFNQQRIVTSVVSNSGTFGVVVPSAAVTCSLAPTLVIGLGSPDSTTTCNVCSQFGLTLQVITTDGGYARRTNGDYVGGSCSNTWHSISPTQTGGAKTVISNTGDSSTRQTTIDPLISGINGCFLVINYADDSSFDYGEIPCDAEILLIPDCCEYPKSKQKINNILAILNGA